MLPMRTRRCGFPFLRAQELGWMNILAQRLSQLLQLLHLMTQDISRGQPSFMQAVKEGLHAKHEHRSHLP